MHSLFTGKTTFNYHGDFSGEVLIHRDGLEISIPFEDIRALVAEYLRDTRIAALEQATPQELVKP